MAENQDGAAPRGVMDAVAAAIRQASYNFWYEKQTLGCDTRGEEEAAYVAAAVVEALALTEEWALQVGANVSRSMSERSARDKAEKWPESFEAICRAVGPWVSVVRGVEQP